VRKFKRSIRKFKRSLFFIFDHPFNQDRKVRVLWIWFRWQIVSRFRKGKHIHQYVDDAKLYVQQGQAGVTGNIYCGLQEWNDMAFVLHFLRPGDLFLDVGANAGSYTILASGAAKANTISVEPIPSTYHCLLSNIALNSLEEIVEPLNIGLASHSGSLRFTNNLDAQNHVVTDTEVNSTLVKVDTLDNICPITPDLIKIDVEGFEYEVLCGASHMLADHKLAALIVEWNISSGNTDGIKDMMTTHGFSPVKYHVEKREIEQKMDAHPKGNVLFVRDMPRVISRTSLSKPYYVQHKKV
jgi:FkbM family methyltransferase